MKPKFPPTKSQEEEELKKNPINLFTCGHTDCAKLDSMVFEEFKHHLFAVHQIKSDQMKGRKQMTMHMDGDFWFSYSYQWELEMGLKFSQYIKMVRAEDDMMRFNY